MLEESNFCTKVRKQLSTRTLAGSLLKASVNCRDSLQVAVFDSCLANGHVNGLKDDHEFEGAINASFTTKAIHHGQQIPERSYRRVIPPIYLSSNYDGV